MIYDVAVLYVDERGPYPTLVRHWYDAVVDARSYAGPLPVVVHPPCGPWGRLRHLSKKDDPRLALYAVNQVRLYGGVLEHPADSKLFRTAGLPHPGEPADAWGGRTIRVNQVDWGHVARKPTWLYIVGDATVPPFPRPRQPTHWISGGRGRDGKKSRTTPLPPGIKVCSAEQRRRTPVAFAKFLIEIARSTRRAKEVA